MIDTAFRYIASQPRPPGPPGAVVEFGVWQGGGLEILDTYARRYLGDDVQVYGFDTFTGMPVTAVDLQDDHREAWRPGGYNDTSLAAVQTRVPRATLIAGEFRTLSRLADYGIRQVRLARIDCDLYEGYQDALRLLTPTLQPGSLLLFDEGVAPDDPRYHDSIAASGERAIREWEATGQWKLRTLEAAWTERLAVVEAGE